MNPNNSDLDTLINKLLLKKTDTPIPSPKAKQKESKDTIQIKEVFNILPYSCIVEIIPPPNIDWVYYGVVDSKNKRLIFKSEYPTKTLLPAFSIHELDTKEKNVRFVCWPVIKDKMGTPTYYPIALDHIKQLGIYDLKVNFDKQADADLFKQVKPLIEKHYGKAALPGPITVVEAHNDIYLPHSNTMQLSADRRNIIHELIHTCRKQLLFANKKCKYNEETEMIEEFFAEGVCNMIKDELNLSPNAYLQEGAVYGSTQGYNYDFRIVDHCLATQNLQSTTGGILTLETSRYYLASEAFHKIAVEYFIRTGKYFGKEFNDVYYAYIEKTGKDPDKELFFTICERLTPTVERIPTRQWLIDQQLFNSIIQKGEKIYMDIDDYITHSEWIGITKINLYQTFENGSDWVDGKHKYDKNGTPVKIEVIHVASGAVAYSRTQKIPDYKNGFGSIKLYFHNVVDSPTVDHFQKQDVTSNIHSSRIKVDSGLYRIQLTSANATQIYYRLLGACMFDNKDKIMVVNSFPHSDNAAVQIAHYSREGKRIWIDSNPLVDQLCTIEVPFIENKNCAPGVLQIIYTDRGTTQTFQRNIGYGGLYGGHQFLINASSEKAALT